MPGMTDITHVLNRIRQGDPAAAAELLPLVYAELRQLAARRMDREPSGQTLQATALVHEAYLRLVNDDVERPWDHRGHFFAAAAEAMRRILVENARRKRGPKHGGRHQRQDIELDHLAADGPAVDLVALDEALDRLAAESPARAELVKLRFFGGLTMPEAAACLGVSLATAERYWTFAKSWLLAELADERPESGPQAGKP
jgi:RNA polymerase sigma factor (TIGR02999 family)